MRGSLVAVVGLRREARRVAAPGVVCVVGGGDEQGLGRRLEAAAAASPVRAVVSVGIAGALAAELELGDWVVGERVVSGSDAWPADPALAGELGRALPSARRGAIAAGSAMLATPEAKAALHARTGALAVDMESHVAARFAAARGLSFAVVRVISDTAERALPPAALAGMRPDGGMDVGAVLRALARDPRQFPALVRTGREAEVAFRRLRLLGRHHLLGRLGVGDADLGQLAVHMV